MCPAQVAIVKLTLELAGLPMEQGVFRGLPMTTKDLASCAVDVAQHIGAGIGRRPSPAAVREGAQLAGYCVSRGRVDCKFDRDYAERVPHWRERNNEIRCREPRRPPHPD